MLDVKTNPPYVLLDKVQLLSGVDGDQISSHHLTGQRHAVPVERLLHQKVLGATVKHPRLAVCGGIHGKKTEITVKKNK